MIKILHLGKYFPPFRGGIEQFQAELMRQQKLTGLTCSALVHDTKETGSYFDERFGWIHSVKSWAQILFVPISPRWPLKFMQVIGKQRPDILHLHMPNVSVLWLLFLRLKRVKIVVHWHSDVVGAAPNRMVSWLYPLYRIFEQQILAMANLIIVTSPNYLDTSEPLKNWRQKCKVIPLGLVNQPSVPWQSDVSVISILMIGRLSYYKGHRDLLKALKLVDKTHHKWQLNIIGSGEELQRLKLLCAELDLQEKVHWLGGVSDSELNNALEHAHLVVLPSVERTEAFGMVLLEAMRAGRPCLVTDVPGSGMSWVVQSGVTGWIAKHNDYQHLAKKITEIMDNRCELKGRGEAGRIRFKQHFDIVKVNREITQCYKELLATNAD